MANAGGSNRGTPPGLFTLLGTTAFALILALGLLATHATQIDAALARLSLPTAWAAIPIMAAGLFLARTPARRGLPVAWQTAGLTVALVGMIAMLVALGMAWPHPLGILVVGAIDCAALAAAAFRFRLPALHAGAIACAALVYLTGFHVIYNDLPLQAGAEGLGPRMLALLLDGSSATALGGMFLLLAAVSELLARRGLHRHGLIYAGGAGVVAAAGLALVTVRGLHDVGPDALRAAILYGIYGCASLAFAARWRRAELSYLGLGLVAAAPIWALWWHPQTHAIGHVWAAVLAAEALDLRRARRRAAAT